VTTTQANVEAALRQAARRNRQLERELDRLAGRDHEPIAIVGVACHFPGGADSLAEFWGMVASATDCIGPVPAARGWGSDAHYQGGFVGAAAEFDAAFFGVGDGEALVMDPQQRLFLETAWEALEDARIRPSDLRGTATGVFAGAMQQGYGSGADESTAAEFGAYGLTGTFLSVVSGRLSYTLGLEGPAVTVDTSCSSSLVALHLACQSLRSGESSLALAGGVTVLVGPESFELFSGMGGVAPDGRCKAFSDRADGTSWGEGVGVLVLETLSEAVRHGRRLHALVRGSAVNQDGASNGLAAPNGPAQQRVIRQALANAGVEPSAVDAVEAHGTGTVLGDPIEAQALLATYGQDRPDGRPLWLGSVKSNFGHTGAAAGMAGVVKMIAALGHEALPPTLWATRPSANVDWGAGAVALLRQAQPWPRGARPRLAGVSSFGVSGTNAHVILEEAPAPVAPTAPEIAPPVLLWPVSGRGEAGLRAQTGRLAGWARHHPAVDPLDVGRSLATTRDWLPDRAIVLAHDRAGLIAGLDQVASGVGPEATPTVPPRSGRTLPTPMASGVGPEPAGPGWRVVTGRAAPRPRLALLFSGQGSQWPGMGRALAEASPVFRQALDEACAACDRHLPTPLRPVMFGTAAPDGPALEQTQYAQPALFALGWALAHVVADWGLTPSVLLGHSVGEITAAAVAGVFSLADAAWVVAERARLMQAVATPGAMLAIPLSETAARRFLADRNLDAPDPATALDPVEIAAVNGPASIVLTGPTARIDQAAGWLRADGLTTSRLRVSHAFHSAALEPALAQFRASLRHIELKAPSLPVISNLTGQLLSDDEARSADYWAAQARRPVRFAAGLATMAAQGVTLALEAGPRPSLSTLAALQVDGLTTGCLLDPDGDSSHLLSAAAQAAVQGLPVDWSRLVGGERPGVDLPSYAFQHRDYWLPRRAHDRRAVLTEAGLTATGHPFLGGLLTLADGTLTILTGTLSVAQHPWLADHAIAGRVVFPGSAFLDLAWQAAAATGHAGVADLTLLQPLLLDPDQPTALQVTVDGDGRLAIYSWPAGADRPAGALGPIGDADGRIDVAGGGTTDAASAFGLIRDSDGWIQHATGRLGLDPVAPPPVTPPPWPPIGARPLADRDFYALVARHDYHYGPAFQGLRQAWTLGEVVYADIETPPRESGFRFPPSLLDACLHPLLAAAATRPPEASASVVYLPFSFTGARLHRPTPGTRVRATLRLGAGDDAVSLRLDDPTGHVLAEIGGLVSRPVDPTAWRARALGEDLYAVTWVPAETVPALPGATPVPALPGGTPVPALPLPEPLLADEGLPPADQPSPDPRLGQADRHWAVVGPPDSPLAIAGAQAGADVFPDLAAFRASLADRAAAPALVCLEVGVAGADLGPSPVAAGVEPDPSSTTLPHPAPGDDAVPPSLPVVGLPEAARQVGHAVLAALRLWLTEPGLQASRLAVVTSGAVAAGPGDRVTQPHQAAAWGLVRSAQSEHPGRFLLMDSDAASLDRVAGAVGAAENQLALRSGEAWAPRLSRQPVGPAAGSPAGPAVGDRPFDPQDTVVTDAARLAGPLPTLDPTSTVVTDAAGLARPLPTFDPRGTVVITGGTGALGGLLARHLARTGQVAGLVLLSRRGPDAPGAADLVNDLAACGVGVVVSRCDAADRAALAAALAAIPADRPLTGVVHAAGAVDDHLVADLTDDHVDAALAGKVAPAWHLHELTRHNPDVATVYYSSLAGLVGTPGQANYAAANTVLDALAATRRAAGLPTWSLAWGAWERPSAITAAVDASQLARAGIRPLTDEAGLVLFDRALSLPEPLLVPAALDLPTLAAAGPLLPPLWRLLVPSSAAARGGPAPLRQELAALSPDERRPFVLETVLRHTAAVIPGSAPEADATFKDLGLQSLGAVELRNRLLALTGLPLPATLVFDHPTPAAVADYILDGLGLADDPGETPALHHEIAELLSRLDPASLAALGIKETLLEAVAALDRPAATPAAGGSATPDYDQLSDDELIALVLGDEERGSKRRSD